MYNIISFILIKKNNVLTEFLIKTTSIPNPLQKVEGSYFLDLRFFFGIKMLTELNIKSNARFLIPCFH